MPRGKTKWVIEERYFNHRQIALVVEVPVDAPMQMDDVDGKYDMYRTAYKSQEAAERELPRVQRELAEA